LSKVGDEIEVKILRVDTDERKIGLSRKRVQWSEEQAAEEQAAEASAAANGASGNAMAARARRQRNSKVASARAGR